MSYTTISKVREISGFDDSDNIGDPIVKGKISAAEAMFDSAAAARYLLPFNYHKQNTLTFAGDGTGAGTMAIVVNGVTYNITISNELTASQAADLFRDAGSDSDDFIIGDAIGDGEEVLIISRTDSEDLTTALAEVNITSAPDTQGITATIGVRIDRYAPMIDQITAEIAASLLLMDNYGIEAQDTPKDGDRRMERINETLQKIQGVHESDVIIRLFDEVDKSELTLTNVMPEGLPNNTTNEDTEDPTAAKISINTVY
jgi:hypothetical protein